jgi:hypothetical protein
VSVGSLLKLRREAQPVRRITLRGPRATAYPNAVLLHFPRPLCASFLNLLGGVAGSACRPHRVAGADPAPDAAPDLAKQSIAVHEGPPLSQVIVT